MPGSASSSSGRRGVQVDHLAAAAPSAPPRRMRRRRRLLRGAAAAARRCAAPGPAAVHERLRQVDARGRRREIGVGGVAAGRGDGICDRASGGQLADAGLSDRALRRRRRSVASSALGAAGCGGPGADAAPSNGCAVASDAPPLQSAAARSSHAATARSTSGSAGGGDRDAIGSGHGEASGRRRAAERTAASEARRPGTRRRASEAGPQATGGGPYRSVIAPVTGTSRRGVTTLTSLPGIWMTSAGARPPR